MKELLDLYPSVQVLKLGDEYLACHSGLMCVRERVLPISDIMKHIDRVMFLPDSYVTQIKDVMLIVKSDVASFGDPDSYLDQVFCNMGCLEYMAKLRTIITTCLLTDMLTTLAIVAEPPLDVKVMSSCLHDNVDMLGAKVAKGRGK